MTQIHPISIRQVAPGTTEPRTAEPRTSEPSFGQSPSLREAAAAFEAIFLRQMLVSMRTAKLADDPLASSASDQFRDMADARTADAMSQQRVGSQQGFGIASMLLAQWTRQDSTQSNGHD